MVRPRERLRIVNFTSGGDVLLFSRRVQDVISLDLTASRGREMLNFSSLIKVRLQNHDIQCSVKTS